MCCFENLPERLSQTFTGETFPNLSRLVTPWTDYSFQECASSVPHLLLDSQPSDPCQQSPLLLTPSYLSCCAPSGFKCLRGLYACHSVKSFELVSPSWNLSAEDTLTFRRMWGSVFQHNRQFLRLKLPWAARSRKPEPTCQMIHLTCVLFLHDKRCSKARLNTTQLREKLVRQHPCALHVNG